MNIGFNDTRFFTIGNLIAGFSNVVGALGVGAVGYGAAFLTQRTVHKIAMNYFNVESTSNKLAAFELVCGGLVGLGVSVSLACYCPVFESTIAKVAKLAVVTGIIGGISLLCRGGDLELTALSCVPPLLATTGAVIGVVGRPSYAIVGLLGTALGAIYGVGSNRKTDLGV